MDEISQQDLFNTIIAHQAYLYRLSTSEVAVILKSFDQVSNRKLSLLRDALDELSEVERRVLISGRYTTSNLKVVRDVVQSWQTSTAALTTTFTESNLSLAIYEANFQARLLAEKPIIELPKANTQQKIDLKPSVKPDSKPIQIDLPGGKVKTITPEKLYDNIRNKPMSGGSLIDSVFGKISNDLKEKVEATIRDGINQGQTNQEIIQRIKGKKVNDYKDGLLDQTRNNIDAMVRTVRSHVANESTMNIFDALGVEYIKFLSVLDSRTTKVCASLDQTVYKRGDSYPSIPLHVRCRSTYIPVTNPEGETIGNRPENQRLGKRDALGHIGTVNSNVSFKDWFADQSEDFQEYWLGKKRFQLYKEGGYTIDKFVDPLNNKMFTLADLKRMDEASFKKAGL